jgi:hypothetical protein
MAGQPVKISVSRI